MAARRVAGATGGGRDPAVARGPIRDGGPRHRAGADRRRSPGRARLGPARRVRRDGRRRVHRGPAGRRGDGGDQCRRHDREPAPHPARTRERDGRASAASSSSTSATRSTRTPCARRRSSSRPKRPPRDGHVHGAAEPRRGRSRRGRGVRRGGADGSGRARPSLRRPAWRTDAAARIPVARRAGLPRPGAVGAGRAVLGRRAGGRTRRPGVELPRRVRRLAPPHPRSPSPTGSTG